MYYVKYIPVMKSSATTDKSVKLPYIYILQGKEGLIYGRQVKYFISCCGIHHV